MGINTREMGLQGNDAGMPADGQELSVLCAQVCE